LLYVPAVSEPYTGLNFGELELNQDGIVVKIKDEDGDV
jgi:hypothetical protein